MTYTRDQLVQSVAERLGLSGDGQPLVATDADTIISSLDGIVADIIGRGIIDDVHLDGVDDAVFPHLSAMIASEIADLFRVDDATTARLAGRAMVGERRLREQRSLPFSSAPQKAVYY